MAVMEAGESTVVTKFEFKGIGDQHKFKFDWCIFPNDKTASEWISNKEIGLNHNMSPTSLKAPKTLRESFGGDNPTLEYIINRKWGIDGVTSWIRKVRTDTDQICVYWRVGPKCPTTYQNPRTTKA